MEPPGLVSGRVRWYALVSLLLLSATLAEFLTGSTLIRSAIASPPGFAILVGMYGGGAILIREAALRMRKGWGAVLLLGGAYAVGEEGFGAKTLIDPLTSNIGDQLYTHWMGVNWVPLSALTLFHAAFSITVPLVVVELLFPRTKGRPLLGRRGLVVAAMVYPLAIYLVSLGDPFRPSPAQLAFLSVYASAFIAAAVLVPPTFLSASRERPDRPESRFLILGLGFMGCFFLIDVLGAHFLPWPVAAALFIPLAACTGWYLTMHSGRSYNELMKVDFVIGMVLVFVPIDTIIEWKGDTGVLVYTGFVLVLLFGIRRRIEERFRHDPAAAEGSASAPVGPSLPAFLLSPPSRPQPPPRP